MVMIIDQYLALAFNLRSFKNAPPPTICGDDPPKGPVLK